MKLKYYLRGLGTGVLFATIVLFIAYSYRMTDAKIKEEALKLGMVYPETEQTGETDTTGKEQSTTSSQIASGEVTTADSDSTEGTTTEEGTSKEPSTEETTTQKPSEEPSETSDSDTEITCVVNVTNSTVSSDVAYKLQNAGIIDDAEEFNNYLINNGYAFRIQNGEFTFTKGMTYNQMAEMLVSRQY